MMDHAQTLDLLLTTACELSTDCSAGCYNSVTVTINGQATLHPWK